MAMDNKCIRFALAGMQFEYDENKEQYNIEAHGISLRTGARVFFDYDYIEREDIDNECKEVRYNIIGDTSAGNALSKDYIEKVKVAIGNVRKFSGDINDILFVVYTERQFTDTNGKKIDTIRLISARRATSFERGLYYGKY